MLKKNFSTAIFALRLQTLHSRLKHLRLMRVSCWFSVFLFFFFLLSPFVFAQTDEDTALHGETSAESTESDSASRLADDISELPDDSSVEESAAIPVAPKAVLKSTGIAQTGRNIIFDASESFNPFPETELVYLWDFGDGSVGTGEEIVHMYAQTGEYDLSLTVRDVEGREDIFQQKIFVYEKLLVLVTDVSAQRERIENLVEDSRQRGIYVQLIESFDSVSDFVTEDVLKKKFAESIADIRKADQIIFWTQSSLGLNLIPQFQNIILDFRGRDILFISDINISLLTNIARSVFRTVQPNKIILTRPESLWVLVDSISTDVFLNRLEQRGIDSKIIDSSTAPFGFFSFMSQFIQFMIDKGISSNSIILVLLLPVIVTVVAFMKQVIGMTTLGVYTPSIIALSFVALDITYGLLILIILLVIGTLIRLFLSKYRMLYIPRMAIVLTFVSFTILGILFLAAIFNISDLVSISIFPMLIMSTLTEKFVSIQTGKGFRSAMILISETILVSIICYYLAQWEFLRTLMLGHPELIFVFLLINIILGRWTGLRLFEYIRFREVLKHAKEE